MNEEITHNTFDQYLEAARNYFNDAPEWVFENETVQQSVRAGIWGTYGRYADGARGLLGWTVHGPDGSEYTFEYRGLQCPMF